MNKSVGWVVVPLAMIGALLLISCPKKPQPPIALPPPPPPTAAPPPPHIPARDVLHRGEAAPSGLGAYGYVVFTSRPMEGKTNRHTLVCESFLRNFESREQYSVEIEPRFLMVTFWPLLSRNETGSPIVGCSQMVEKYDYAFATTVASAVGKLQTEGPTLVAWIKPFRPGELHADALVLDLSDFEDSDIDRGFAIWKNQIAREPAAWKDGFKLVLAREAFRNLIEKYGQQIVAVILAK